MINLNDKCNKILASTIEMLFNKSFHKCDTNDKSSKLRTLKMVKKFFRSESYIELIKDFHSRQCFTKLRLSDHFLNIETGRKQNIDAENRICKICNSNKVGNEFHF